MRKTLLSIVVLGSVATPAFAGDALVGLSQDKLIECAGLPVQTMQTGDKTYFQYGSSRQIGAISHFGSVMAMSSHATGCDATVTLQGGLVTGVTKRPFGSWLGGPIACAQLLSACP